jgi:NADH-quinone oxidoreductase subunit L
MAMVANDIKRVLAYSSISQLGYMFMGLAAGSLTAGYFHLVTHAGFKALLFLASGIFIHHAHSNDMREIARTGPRVRRAAVFGLVTGGAALAGIIPFSGYFSKEAVLAAVGAHGGAVALLAYLGAGLTAYYTFRMIFLTLSGEMDAGRAHGADHPLHGERWMAAPVILLGVLTLVLGYLGGFLHHRLAPEGAEWHGAFHFGPGAAVALALVAAGVGLAWLEFGRKGAARLGFAERVPAVRAFLGDNWYVDRLYAATVVRLANALSRAAKWNDHTVLDGASDAVAHGAIGSGRLLALLQSGYVQAYVATAVTLLAALAAWMSGGAR